MFTALITLGLLASTANIPAQDYSKPVINGDHVTIYADMRNACGVFRSATSKREETDRTIRQLAYSYKKEGKRVEIVHILPKDDYAAVFQYSGKVIYDGSCNQ